MDDNGTGTVGRYHTLDMRPDMKKGTKLNINDLKGTFWMQCNLYVMFWYSA